MSKMICDADLCTGCGLCTDACPFDAVSQVSDAHGFYVPVTDSEKCTDCGVCREVCPINSKKGNGAKKVYASYAKDPDVRKRSSSGGIFRLLADKTLESGGVVAAVGYDGSFRAVYKIADSPAELDELMGSKYTESAPDGIYSKVKEYLDRGVRVLFVGTPCRVAAIKNLIPDDERLLTVDLICHGVPSAKLLESFLSENFSGKIKEVHFRDKTKGWQEFSMKVDEEGKKPYVVSQYKDPYLRVFLGNSALRECCYDCRFKDDNYRSDITLGDFWGISSCIPSMNDDRGTSAVVIRTDAGADAFEKIRGLVVCKETDEASLTRANAALIKSSKKPASRDDMLACLRRGDGFSAIAEHFGKPAPATVIISERIKRAAKKILGKIKK
ncbi:MAG: Coenzyme F420 hydrogenase/dehydrogenase, beta subunit C-terminal domain [Clostridia bacterium]|nr:Coenzyme F420 hydrogenase/dehydrogenase, beta subunit C-terminal domain [Clostridia bacterium]